MLILECSQGCCTVKNLPRDLDLWPWKSIGFQTLLRTKYVPSLVKINCGKNLIWWPWPYSNATVRPSHPCEHSRINILQWILTKLGTYLVLKRIWNPIDFQCHRSKVTVNKGNAKHGVSPRLKIRPCDLDLGHNPLQDVDSSVHKDVTR
jgi:hypothetical protein